MTKRNKRISGITRFAIFIWSLVIIVTAMTTILHALGWIIITAIIAAGSYYAGRQDALKRARAQMRSRKRLRQNADYGKAAPAYRGGSLPREPVEDTDAVSAYPAELTSRARLLRDPMSGVRKLFDSDE